MSRFWKEAAVVFIYLPMSLTSIFAVTVLIVIPRVNTYEKLKRANEGDIATIRFFEEAHKTGFAYSRSGWMLDKNSQKSNYWKQKRLALERQKPGN